MLLNKKYWKVIIYINQKQTAHKFNIQQKYHYFSACNFLVSHFEIQLNWTGIKEATNKYLGKFSFTFMVVHSNWPFSSVNLNKSDEYCHPPE